MKNRRIQHYCCLWGSWTIVSGRIATHIVQTHNSILWQSDWQAEDYQDLIWWDNMLQSLSTLNIFLLGTVKHFLEPPSFLPHLFPSQVSKVTHTQPSHFPAPSRVLAYHSTAGLSLEQRLPVLVPPYTTTHLLCPRTHEASTIHSQLVALSLQYPGNKTIPLSEEIRFDCI